MTTNKQVKDSVNELRMAIETVNEQICALENTLERNRKFKTMDLSRLYNMRNNLERCVDDIDMNIEKEKVVSYNSKRFYWDSQEGIDIMYRLHYTRKQLWSEIVGILKTRSSTYNKLTGEEQLELMGIFENMLSGSSGWDDNGDYLYKITKRCVDFLTTHDIYSGGEPEALLELLARFEVKDQEVIVECA